MTTIWPTPSTFPVAKDVFTPVLLDNVDEVIANHPNSLADAIMNVQDKLGLDNELVTDTGGLKFDSTGYAAPPLAPPNVSLWMDTSGGPGLGYPIKYTDQLGVSYDLRVSGGVGFVGVGYSCLAGTLVGDLMYVSAADTLLKADAVVGDAARGMVINVYGGGTTCDIAYGAEITNGGWALIPDTVYYLDTAGGFATAPPLGWTVQQEIGFARNATTMVFRPTIASV
jgi:hypothetical protein